MVTFAQPARPQATNFEDWFDSAVEGMDVPATFTELFEFAKAAWAAGILAERTARSCDAPRP